MHTSKPDGNSVIVRVQLTRFEFNVIYNLSFNKLEYISRTNGIRNGASFGIMSEPLFEIYSNLETVVKYCPLILLLVTFYS